MEEIEARRAIEGIQSLHYTVSERQDMKDTISSKNKKDANIIRLYDF